jgi:hypothetical protein
MRLYTAGFPTVGALDALIGSYGEDQLRSLVGRIMYAKVMAALFSFCQRRLLEQLAKGKQ